MLTAKDLLLFIVTLLCQALGFNRMKWSMSDNTSNLT
jgi:hypothetical protein